MAVAVVGVMVMRVPGLRGHVSFVGEPAPDIGDFAFRVVQSAVQELRRGGVRRRRHQDRGRRIERAQARDQALDGYLLPLRVDEIGLGQHDAVGDRGLLDRLHVRVERGIAVDGVDHGDHAVEPVAHAAR